MIRPFACGACLLAILALAPPGRAQEDVVAFGDSITEGPFPFDEDNRGGYPPRLQDLLREGGLTEVVVFNEGLSSEKTFEGLSRIDSTIQQHSSRAKTFIIMEGTNDVTRISLGEFSIESTMRNLEAMASKVRAQAIDVVYSTVIPRPTWAVRDRFNVITFDLVFRLRELTSTGNRVLAEPWAVIENQGIRIFDDLYFCCDSVGHPNAAGFQVLAETFADKLLDVDRLAPVVSSFSKSRSTATLAAGETIFAIVHESGEGIRKADTYFTLNGRAVSTEVEGSKRRVQLSHRVSREELGCGARITVRSEDGAEPPNVRNRKIAEFDVADVQLLKGDVNGDCRVDGFDLGLLGLGFGSVRGELEYSRLADSNNDGKIDGEDLARLARNFGKDSS